jgi:periplasmic protein TonB
LGVEPTFVRNAPVWPLTAFGRLPEEAPDPAFFLPDGLLEKGAREAVETIYLNDRSPTLLKAPVERLGPSAPKIVRHGKWHAAIAASLIFHAAVAWFFIDSTRDDVLIEGSENAGITMLGSSSEDQMAEGDVEATQVTLIDLVEPKSVGAVTAETVPVVETAEAVPVETAEAVEEVVAEASVPETVQAEALPVTPLVEAETAPPEGARAVPQEKPSETVAETPPPMEKPVEDAVPVLRSEAPEILAVDKLAPGDETTAVAKHAQAVEATEAAKTETVETAEAIPAEPSEVVREVFEPVKPVKETPPEPKPVAKVEPKPVKKPVEAKKPVEPKRKKAAKKPAEKPAEKKTADAKPKKKATKAGSGGANQADARRGAADGAEAGTTAAKGKKGKTASSGNASVSNYPGKVVSQLRRAVYSPAEARAKRLKGEVQVSFTVSANGSVGGVRVVRSSGSPILDKAALETVRRAAPFPAIPSDAGRSSWPFTVPLAFVR